MIDPQEHVYDDDPCRGHSDVRTRLADVSYFFLGNGLIQAAVQWAPSGEGTPLGLLVMDPERLGKKREALTQDLASGLEATAVEVWEEGLPGKANAGDVRAWWVEDQGVPAVVAEWSCPAGLIEECFFCPDCTTARIVRQVRRARATGGRRLHVRTGIPGHSVTAVLEPGADSCASFVYDLSAAGDSVSIHASASSPSREARSRWASRTRLEFGHPQLDRLVRNSQYQIEAALSQRGRMDSSIWQYNREWVRDQAFVAIGYLMTGDGSRARRILRRLLDEFVTPDGGAMDSSEARTADEAEIDQNGILLLALEQYVRWTGDASLLEESWPRIAATADYPLRPMFAEGTSGLLCNVREFWERHSAHGIRPGLELAHQVFVSLGLRSAASLAKLAGRNSDAVRWLEASGRLRTAALSHPTHALVADGCLIKRRDLDGSLQDEIVPRTGSLMPAGVPLMQPGSHRLNPDTCAALPIVYHFIDPASTLARTTLDSVERLWNQRWTTGGYGRYDVTSEPDSPGGWPFASLFVARAAIEAGLGERAWRVLQWLDQVSGAPAGSWFEFYGQRFAPPFPQVGIIPWTWAEVLALGTEQLLGIRHDAGGLRVSPHLLPGLDHASARVPMCGGELCVRVSRERRSRPVVRVTVDGRPERETAEREALVPRGVLRGGVVDLEMVLATDRP
jgi:hypothetical protein